MKIFTKSLSICEIMEKVVDNLISSSIELISYDYGKIKYKDDVIEIYRFNPNTHGHRASVIVLEGEYTKEEMDTIIYPMLIKMGSKEPMVITLDELLNGCV